MRAHRSCQNNSKVPAMRPVGTAPQQRGRL